VEPAAVSVPLRARDDDVTFVVEIEVEIEVEIDVETDVETEVDTDVETAVLVETAV
jgi:hypothetical protein